MNRPILVCALFVAAIATLGAQETSQSNPYQGVSNPPSDDTITTVSTPQPKPPAGHRYVQPAATAQPQAQTQTQTQALKQAPSAPQPAPANSSVTTQHPAAVNGADGEVDGTDSGIVIVTQPATDDTPPPLAKRADAPDPDGDIVHPAPLGLNELGEGTTIRVRLLTGLSSSMSERGEVFRSRVASDVLQGNRVLIPTGSEINGRVVEVSSGHLGGHGTLLLRPENVILPGGSSYQLHAVVYGTPGSRTNVESEGVIAPDSQLKRDSIEYGGGVGAGAVTGAILAGPAGALAGTLIGAGAVTTHLLVSHPQAHLEEGAVLLLTLTQPLDLVPAHAGNEVSKR